MRTGKKKPSEQNNGCNVRAIAMVEVGSDKAKRAMVELGSGNTRHADNGRG